MMDFIAYLPLILYGVPAIFWFILIRKFNRKTKAKFPALVYSILYLIPAVNLITSWSFVSDIREYQNKSGNRHPISKVKIYLLNLALPYLCLSVGTQLFAVIGAILSALNMPSIGIALLESSIAAPFIGFIWFAWGFWSLAQIIDSR